MKTSRKYAPSPNDEEPILDLSGKDEDDVHGEDTAVGNFAAALEEARRAMHAQPTAKVDKFDLEAALERAKRNSLTDAPPAALPSSGTRVRASAPSHPQMTIEPGALPPSELDPVRPTVQAAAAPFTWPLLVLLLDVTLLVTVLLMALLRR